MTNKHELYFKAAQSAKIGIWELNFETKLIYWDIVTKNIHEVDPEFIPDFENAMNFYVEGENRAKINFFVERACKKGLPFEEQFQILSAKKNVKHVKSIGYVKYENGKPSILFGTFHDITTEQNLINKLQLSFEKFSSVFSSANDSIIIIDSLTGIITDCNSRSYELIKYDFNELIGQHISILFPVKKRKNVEYFLEKKINQDNYFVNEAYIKTKKNKTIPVEVASGKIFKVKEKSYLVCFIRDVTAKKEKELELNRVLEVTSQQNNKLFNFAHIISHNIRSHTSNLSLVLDVMEGTEDKDEKLSFVGMLKEGTDKLLETIEYLNEIITIQENTNIKKEKIGLKEEIEKIKISLSPKISKSQLKIIHSIPEELMVNAVPPYLDSILLNLFTNAIKYRSKDREAILEIDYEIDPDYTIIHFKDNGLGINLNKNRHKIFGMYKTFHGNEDARGIGLFIIKNQIEAMNGKIEVESEEGKGSLFKIYLNNK